MGGRNKRIPDGLVDFFLQRNEELVWPAIVAAIQEFQSKPSSSSLGGTNLMTVSHFLPNSQCLPDWKDVHSETFDRDSWLDHGGGSVSAKFAKVAGTKRLDEQIRKHQGLLSLDRQIHVFGHSHRPKNFEMEGIRYIHNPLGKPREREICMVSPHVEFQPVWDTRTGEIKGETIIRFWEEQGGGMEALRMRLQNSKRKTRYGKGYKKVNAPSPTTNRA